MSVVVESQLSGISVKRGKVRDVYDLGDTILFVASDRISASTMCCQWVFLVRVRF